MQKNIGNKIIIGTAQFGSKYGIANTSGMIKNNEFKKITQFAKKLSIKSLDTAPSYGASEKKIGNLQLSRNFKIYSKINKLSKNHKKDTYRELLEKNLNRSLNNLKINTLEGIFLHQPLDLLKQNGDVLYKFLKDKQKEKLIKKIGISVYSVSEAKKIINEFEFDMIQFPVNLFNQEFISNGFISKLKKNKIQTFARSIFLQGLLLMENIPIKLNKFKRNFLKYENFINKYNFTKLEATIYFIKSIEDIDYYIIGFQNLNEFKQIMDKFQNKTFNVNWKECSFSQTKLLNPSLW